MSIVCLLLCVFFIWKLWPKLQEYKESAEAYEKIRQEVEEDPDAEIEVVEGETDGDIPGWLSVNWDGLNENCIAWLVLDDISYPVMKDRTDGQYLHHLPDGSYNYGGSLFVEMDQADDFSDPNTFIYGHNMANGSMFGNLRRYRSSDYKDHQFTLYFRDGTRRRYVFTAVVNTTVSSDVYQKTFEDTESFLAYQKWMKASTLYQTGIDPAEDAKLVTLSCCSGGEGTSKRLVVQGRQIAVERLVGNTTEPAAESAENTAESVPSEASEEAE